MADISVSPIVSPRMAMTPPRMIPSEGVAASAGVPKDQLDLSTASLDDHQVRDAILMKIALEGKDFHTARREVLEERAAADDGSSPEASQPTPPSTGRWQQGQGVDLEITAIQVVHVEAELTTPDMHLSVQATRIEAMRVSLTSRRPAQKQDPLLIDMDNSGPQTTGNVGARAFDLAGNGQVLPTSFVQGNSAFLALDRNGDGRIDNGKELFGDQHGAPNGYEELRKFDADANGQIDAVDPVYANLQLLYGNGSLVPVTSSGVRSISLNAYSTALTTAAGDDVLSASAAEMSDGRHLKTYAMALQTFEISA